jgi:hypothetical protein
MTAGHSISRRGFLGLAAGAAAAAALPKPLMALGTPAADWGAPELVVEKELCVDYGFSPSVGHWIFLSSTGVYCMNEVGQVTKLSREMELFDQKGNKFDFEKPYLNHWEPFPLSDTYLGIERTAGPCKSTSKQNSNPSETAYQPWKRNQTLLLPQQRRSQSSRAGFRPSKRS